jgi:hypothetical protein
MITRTLSAYLKTWIDTEAHASVIALPVYVAGDATTMSPPCIIIEDGNAAEHEILDEVYDVTLSVTLRTIARVDDGTTTDAHFTLASYLRACLNRRDNLLTYLNGTTNIYAYDISGMSDTTATNDDVRETTYQINITALELNKT